MLQSTASSNQQPGRQIGMLALMRPALVSLIIFTILLGLLYPAVITGIAQLIFPNQANGSLLRNANGTILGSAMIGQEFSDPAYFWGRPSATGPVPYNAAASSGSNLGPLNPALIGEDGIVQTRINALRTANAAVGIEDDAAIPVDLVTASGSGLDPHISPAAAQYQVARVATLRGAELSAIQSLVQEHTEGRAFWVLGEVRVNVLQLNLALDELYPLP